MKIIAIVWYVGMIAVTVVNIFRVPPHWCLCVALGCLCYHSCREIKAWLKL